MTRVVINRITGAYWPAASGLREPSLNQYGELIPRDDGHLVRVVEGPWEAADGHATKLCKHQGEDLVEVDQKGPFFATTSRRS